MGRGRGGGGRSGRSRDAGSTVQPVATNRLVENADGDLVVTVPAELFNQVADDIDFLERDPAGYLFTSTDSQRNTRITFDRSWSRRALERAINNEPNANTRFARIVNALRLSL